MGQLSDLWGPLGPAFEGMGWSAEVHDRLREAARRLPRVGAFGLEVHPGLGRVDLALQLWPGGRATDQAFWSLSGRDRALLPEGVAGFLDRWRSTPGLHDPGTSAFVEIDLDGSARPPSLFLAFGAPPSPELLARAAVVVGLSVQQGERIAAWARERGAIVRHVGARALERGVEARVSANSLSDGILWWNDLRAVAVTVGFGLDAAKEMAVRGVELKPLGGWPALEEALRARGVELADTAAWSGAVAGGRLFRNHLKLDPEGRRAKVYLGVGVGRD